MEAREIAAHHRVAPLRRWCAETTRSPGGDVRLIPSTSVFLFLSGVAMAERVMLGLGEFRFEIATAPTRSSPSTSPGAGRNRRGSTAIRHLQFVGRNVGEIRTRWVISHPDRAMRGWPTGRPAGVDGWVFGVPG